MTTATLNTVEVDELMFAIVNNDNNRLGTLLKKSIDNVVNSLLPRSKITEDKECLSEFIQTTPLFAAVKTGNVEATKMLLDKGANIKQIVSSQDGILLSAYDLGLHSGNIEIMDMLKEYAMEKGMMNKGVVSATNVIRSGKSQAMQYGSKSQF